MTKLLLVFSLPLVVSGVLLCLSKIRAGGTKKPTNTKTLWLFVAWSAGLFLFAWFLWWRGGW
ncbi:MAG TPA: hypothetical protein VKJ47_01150 [Candidatus Binatia bacterium]|nr:hypothetical protein [Candidatus Binatia bacterium]